MDIEDQNMGSLGINFPSVPLANMKTIVLLKKQFAFYPEPLNYPCENTLWSISQFHVLRKPEQDQGSKDVFVELVHLNLLSPRCLQKSINDRWLNDPIQGYQGLSPVLVLSSGNLDNRDYSWKRL